MFLFGLRQMCQAVSALPLPEGMIWRSPGVPSLLVTYDVANDLFFSGHTAMAVYGAIELARWGGARLGNHRRDTCLVRGDSSDRLAGSLHRISARGAVTAVLAVMFADAVGPTCDGWLVSASRMLFG